MSAIARLLFPLPATRRSPATILRWWESRRLTYNAIVGSAGLLTLGSLSVLNWLPPHLPFDVPWQAIVLYGVCANACYSFGGMFEALAARLWGDEVLPVGPTLFRHGLVFSVGLTLLPIGLGWIGYLVGLAKWLLPS